MQHQMSIAQILVELERQNLLPAIVFRSARAQCDVDTERAGTNRRIQLSAPQQYEIQNRIREVARRYDMDLELITSHPQYKSLFATGIGAHHAGQLLMWRLLLEELMVSGLMRILVATGTVAAGVDFPARTVVVTAHSRRGSEGFRAFTSAEFQQMSGRAGRRGKDTVGFCLAAPSQFCDARKLQQIARKPPEPLESSYFPSPSTVLNLLRYRTVDGLTFTVQRSLAAFIDKREATLAIEEAEQIESTLGSGGFDDEHQKKKAKKRVRRLRRQAEELGNNQSTLLDSSLRGLRTLGYVEGDSLSEKGNWAANLCTSLVIELGEMIQDGLFDNASAERLVCLIAAVAGDPHRPYLRGKESPLDKESENKINEILNRVGAQGMPGVPDDRQALPDASRTALQWLYTEDWSQFRAILVLSGVQEGDAARLITQTAEYLNQLARLSQSHSELAHRAEEAKRKILRPPLTEAIEF